MSKTFKSSPKDETQKHTVRSPYDLAKGQWDERIGSARVQAFNWRLTAILSLCVSVLLLIILMIVLAARNEHLFVVEVSKAGRVVNVAPLANRYHPTMAQTEYFIGDFIKKVRELPLDPVVAKNNWQGAYHFLGAKSAAKLNEIMRKDNPLDRLGKETVSVKITDINPLSENSFQVDWTETTVNMNGEVTQEKSYSGVFSVVYKEPRTQAQMMQNPLGIYIVDFSISSRASQ